MCDNIDLYFIPTYMYVVYEWKIRQLFSSTKKKIEIKGQTWILLTYHRAALPFYSTVLPDVRQILSQIP